MKKYVWIYKTEIMSNLQYFFDIIAGFVGYFIMIFIFINLWQYMYQDSSELINGYTQNQMIWYVIITEILWMSLKGRTLCGKIVTDVKNGNIAYNINKPYDYVKYIVSSHFGTITVRGIMSILLGMILGFVFLKSFPNLSFIQCILVLFTGILASIINTLFIVSIGLISFFIEDSNPFYWLYSKMILVIGTIFPIEYFPRFLQPLLSFSPIYVVSYGPAKLFVDFHYSTFFSILLAQMIYLFFSYLICSLIYQKGVKKLNVNGG